MKNISVDEAEWENLNDELMVLVSEEKYDQAIFVGEKLLAVAEKNSDSIPASLNNLAMCYDIIGDYAKAEPLYMRALTILEKLKNDHPDIVIYARNFAESYKAQGKYEQAVRHNMRALTILEKKKKDTRPVLKELAQLYYKQGYYEKAELFKMRFFEIEKRIKAKHKKEMLEFIEKLEQQDS